MKQLRAPIVAENTGSALADLGDLQTVRSGTASQYLPNPKSLKSKTKREGKILGGFEARSLCVWVSGFLLLVLNFSQAGGEFL